MSVIDIKSGTTTIAGATVKGSFSYFSGNTTTDLGPTSTTGFYSGIDAPTAGYTVYQIGGPNGWTARVATDDTSLNSILIGAGATGSTLAQRITWATNTNSIFINSGPPPPAVSYYIGGWFFQYKSSSQNYVIEVDNSGTKDTTFNIGTGFNNLVEALRLDSSGKIYVGGAFTTYQGSTQRELIRLNTNGTKDSTFDIGSGFAPNFTAVYDIQIDSSGKIYAGGDFGTFTGTSVSRLIRLNTNGSRDTAFDIGSGFNGTVFCLAIDSNGKIYVGGDFTTYKGSTQNRLIRLNPDGSKDTAFDIGTGFNTGQVNAIAIASDGKIYCGGSFVTYRGTTYQRLIRLNTDGTIDNGFNLFAPGGPILTLLVDSNQKVLAGGSGSWAGLIRYNTNGSTDSTFVVGTGTNSDAVYSVVQDNNGKYLVGGTFTSWNGTSGINRIVRLDSVGTIDTTFSGGTGFNGQVNSIIPITS